MSKVYVVNDMNHSFDKAERFGKIIFATEGKVPIFKTDVVKNMLAESLKDFDIENDFLLLSGPTLLCIIATRILHTCDAPLKTIVFDAKEQDYVVRHLSA